MKYLLLILEDDATIEFDERLGLEFDPPVSPAETNVSLKRLIEGFSDEEKLGRFGILEVHPTSEHRKGDELSASFAFHFTGVLE